MGTNGEGDSGRDIEAEPEPEPFAKLADGIADGLRDVARLHMDTGRRSPAC